MRIEEIKLNNFGSYEGQNQFQFRADVDKNIVLIGGKNGAGKTTLFTAMRVCLYGYLSMGYKNKNSYYIRAITKLINNNAKMKRPATASVEMTITLSNGHELDTYILTRRWLLDDTLTEAFIVQKNGVELSESEVADFEKYLFSLIPPELFNLYFFDGEKIADFFLEDGGDKRVKEAFLTLCGYDTFDIMRKQFKRTGTSSKKSSNVLEDYLAAKERVEQLQGEYDILAAALKKCVDEIDLCEVELAHLDKEYSQSGGITQEEWEKKLLFIREEEKKRDNWNALLRKWANDIVPFIMLRDEIEAVKQQIEDENANLKYKNFCEVLDSPQIKAMISDQYEAVMKQATEQYGGNTEAILDLSMNQTANLLAQINTILAFEDSKIVKCKQAIKKSIAEGAKVRTELEQSNLTTVQEYMTRKAELLERKSNLLAERVQLEQSDAKQQNELTQAKTVLEKTQTKFEEDLKKASIADISAKAILMLDKLQDVLYHRQIEKVEEFFRSNINIMMRKQGFIDDIMIDEDFGIHIFRTDQVEIANLIPSIVFNDENALVPLIGVPAIQRLKNLAGTERLEDVADYLQGLGSKYVELPFEIDKNSLSNGEKQIFIMTLYHALVQLGKNEIPFVIDTPFARIDSEHRKNISQHFFSKLHGQIFILSTNEEIDSEHVQIMKDKIATTYMLENQDNKHTDVIQNTYFEV